MSYIQLKLFLNNSQEDRICIRKQCNGAVVCGRFLTSPFLGEGMKIYVRCFTCPWFKRNVLTSPGTAVVILMSAHHISSQYILFQVQYIFCPTLSTLSVAGRIKKIVKINKAWDIWKMCYAVYINVWKLWGWRNGNFFLSDVCV